MIWLDVWKIDLYFKINKMKLYLREWWLCWREYDVYDNLNEAINERWTEYLYELDLKDNENIYIRSLYEKTYYINKDWEIDWKNSKGDNHYAFIIKNWEDVHNITIEEMVKRVKKFQKRLKKFTDTEKAKHKIEMQIKDLQNQLDELNWK